MSKRLVISLLILVVGIISLAGCLSKSGVLPGKDNTIPQAPTPVEWNFLVYLDGDNNLEQYAIADINEMEQVGSSANINILVLVDRAPGYDTSNGNWTNTRLYKITKDTNTSIISSQLLVNYGELDMANPNTLKNFIVDCQTLYPSNRTVLTLWNHGDGVYPRDETRGICWDDTTGTTAWDCLTGAEVLTALSQARAITGKKIDIINMDACLMQHIEVAHEFRTETNYLVGSQQTIPGAGNNYDGILANLQSNPFQTTASYAQALVNDYYNAYKTTSATMSALDMGTPFTNLVNAFKDFALAMYNTPDVAAANTARTNSVSFTYDEYKDLYALANGIYTYSTDANARSKAAALKTAITNAVLLHKESGTFVGKAFGLSVLLTRGSQWPSYSASNQYVSFPICVDSYWDEFVKRYGILYP